MQPLLYIVVRRTTDWTDEAVVRAQLPAGFAALVDLWNDTFVTPYHQFRAALKRLAQENLARVDGAIVAELEDVPAGALVASVDDDDWFSPEMARVVAGSREPSARAYRWPSLFLEVPPDFDQWLGVWRRRLIPGTPVKWICTTNNYVIEKIPGIDRIVDCHRTASQWFTEHDAEVRVLDVPLSLQNRNMASITALVPRRGAPMTRAKLLRRHRQYLALYARRHRLLPEWSRPWIRRMGGLMEDLEPRPR